MDIDEEFDVDLGTVRGLQECVTESPKGSIIDEAGCIDYIVDILHIITLPKEKEVLFFQNGIYHPDADIYTTKILSEAFYTLKNAKGKPVYTTEVRNHIINTIKELTGHASIKFDACLNLINMENSLYNWKTQEFKDLEYEYLSRI